MSKVVVLTNVEQTTAKIFIVDEETKTPIVEVPEMPLEQAKMLAEWIYDGISQDIAFHNTSLEWDLLFDEDRVEEPLTEEELEEYSKHKLWQHGFYDIEDNMDVELPPNQFERLVE